MTRLAVLAIAGLILAGCNDDRSSAPIASCAVWTVQHSANVPRCITDSIDFPVGRDGVHYVVQPAPGAILGQLIRLRFTIEGDGTLVPTGENPPGPALLRLYIQNRFDDLGGPFGRWWGPAFSLAPGEHLVSYRITPEGEWSSVSGQRSADNPSVFNTDAGMAGQIGFTFGGMFAGHGVYALAPVRFIIREWMIQ